MNPVFTGILVSSVLLTCVSSLNILFASEVISHSHHIFNSALARGLAARGHNVTFLSSDNVKNPPMNLHYIHLEYQYIIEDKYYEGMDKAEGYRMFAHMNRLETIMLMAGFGFDICKEFSKNQGLQTILNYPDDFKFDLMIYDNTGQVCSLGLAHKFKYPPIVGITAFCNPPSTIDIMGGDKLGLTAKPHYILDYDKDMNILQRLDNGFINFIESLLRKYYSLPKIDKSMKELYGNDIPFVSDLEKLVQITLVNSHPAIEFAETLPPNVIEIGGMQIEDPKPVDKDIDEFLKKGKKGSVLMSLGSNFKSEYLLDENVNSIIDVFRQLPDYNFIWKFEDAKRIKNLPKNLMIKPWLSQNDILAHKSIKAFISHAGMLSILESTWHAVPIVGIPIFIDQIRNLGKAISAGVAVKVDIHNITTGNLKSALVELLENPKYTQNMQNRSKVFRDQPEKPLDRAIWWCEYVMRNPNATHLRPIEFNLGLLGSQFWDMQVLSILIIIGFVIVLKRIFKKILCKVCKCDVAKVLKSKKE